MPEERNETLASEIYRDLKEELKFKNRLIVGLVAALLLMGLWHNWRWSLFDTYDIDAGDSGNAIYMGGDNTGGVYSAESGGAASEGRQGAGSQG